MSWIEGTKYKKDLENFNETFLSLKGPLEDKEARITLIKFLRQNLYFTTYLLSGVKLAPYQEITLKGFFNRNFSMCVWGRGCSKCVAYDEDTQVFTKKHGLIALTTIFPKVDFSNGEKWIDIKELELWNGSDWVKTTKLLIQPSVDSRTIETNKGYSLTGSVNHLIKVINADCEIVWKKFSDLVVGDFACISRSPIALDDKDDKDASYLISLILKSGFSAPDLENILDSFSLNRSDEFGQGENALLSCLRSLFDIDGIVTPGKLTIRFRSSSERLAKYVHRSLLLFGVVSSFYERSTTAKDSKRWVVKINGRNCKLFHEKIGFRVTEEKLALEANLNDASIEVEYDKIPFAREHVQNEIRSGRRFEKDLSQEWKKNVRKKSSGESLSYQTIENYINFFKKTHIPSEKLSKLEEIQKENFFFDEIKSIESSTQNCIDFNIPIGERYWSNGFVSHNSFIASIYCFLQCVFEPNSKILIAGPTFRTARGIFNNIEKITESKGAELLMQAFGVKSKRNDLFEWDINGGSIKAIPLNGEKIRGFRANILVLDEFLLLPEEIVKNILMPFLIAPQDISRRLDIRELEDLLIKEGKMVEGDRKVFENNSKMIALSSASYTFENLYKTYQEWIANIESKDKGESSYFVSQVGYQALPEEMVDKTIIEEAQSGGTSHSAFLREYCAQFTDGSDSYFNAKKMESCTLKDEHPHTLIKGNPGKQYVVGIDPNLSDSPNADYFAIAVMELDENNVGILVHTYAGLGSLNNHVKYFNYIMTYFNVVLIIVDNAGADIFLDTCNQSELFKNANINIKNLEFASDSDGLNHEQEMKSAKFQYNLSSHRIAFSQFFTSNFIRKANEHLQACIDYKKVLFASRTCSNENFFNSTVGTKLPNDLIFVGDKSDWSPLDFLEHQDDFIYQTKKQCSLVEYSTTSRGSQSFELPQHLRRSSSATRARKDNYSALLLANWGVKCYNEMMKQNVEEPSTFTPVMF